MSSHSISLASSSVRRHDQTAHLIILHSFPRQLFRQHSPLFLNTPPGELLHSSGIFACHSHLCYYSSQKVVFLSSFQHHPCSWNRNHISFDNWQTSQHGFSCKIVCTGKVTPKILHSQSHSRVYTEPIFELFWSPAVQQRSKIILIELVGHMPPSSSKTGLCT